MSSIKKIAVANRGEIARRIITTCQQMGLKTVLLHASGDEQSEAYRLADEKICIGSGSPHQSYLNVEACIQGALAAGAGALHPGYGFLSENFELAEACLKKGLVFIGPNPEAMKTFADKIKAREFCKKFGLPVLPGAEISSQDTSSDIQKKADAIGYPIMIKARQGGGGRGLRIAHNKEDIKQLIPIVLAEAKASSNSENIFLEKYLESAKHIELQVFISSDEEIFILGDRDCSLQRRHQKIIEEAPSCLPDEMQKKMQELCWNLCKNISYSGAGTLEFLVKGSDFYFLEMNTRLQVEHTVTEMILGLDLVRAQILTAMDRPLFWDSSLKTRGHSIQCRICAEDPYKGFLPTSSTLLSCVWPSLKGVRVDKGFDKGDTISLNYDSLLAKIIVWDSSRVRAIEKMRLALKQTILFGLVSNIPFLQKILSHQKFIDSSFETDFIKKNFNEGIKYQAPFEDDFREHLLLQLQDSPSQSHTSSFNPWSDFLKGKGK